MHWDITGNWEDTVFQPADNNVQQDYHITTYEVQLIWEDK